MHLYIHIPVCAGYILCVVDVCLCFSDSLFPNNFMNVSQKEMGTSVPATEKMETVTEDSSVLLRLRATD